MSPLGAIDYYGMPASRILQPGQPQVSIGAFTLQLDTGCPYDMMSVVSPDGLIVLHASHFQRKHWPAVPAIVAKHVWWRPRVLDVEGAAREHLVMCGLIYAPITRVHELDRAAPFLPGKDIVRDQNALWKAWQEWAFANWKIEVPDVEMPTHG